MSDQEQETVADVLLPHADDPHVKNLRSFALAGIEAHQLAYEDWTRPLKLTGGRVCLQWRDHTSGYSGYVCWHPDGLMWQFDDGDRLTGAHAARELQYCLDDPQVELSPILRERTPFDESEHE